MKYLILSLLSLTLLACGKGAGVSAFKLPEEQITAKAESALAVDDLKMFNPLAQNLLTPKKALANKKWERDGSCYITYYLGQPKELSAYADRLDLCRFDQMSITQKSSTLDEVKLSYLNQQTFLPVNDSFHLYEENGALFDLEENVVGAYDDNHLYYFVSKYNMAYPLHLYINDFSNPTLTIYQIDSVGKSNESITRITMKLK